MSSVYFKANKGMCASYLLEMKRISDFFMENGWTTADSPDAADMMVVGTCVSFDADEQRSIDDLVELGQYQKPVVSFGCLTTYNPERMATVHDGPAISTMDMEKLNTLIPDPQVRFEDIPHPSVFRSREDYRNYDLTRRFVNINFGCYFNCSFCAHKVGIGSLRSRPLDDIIQQMEALKHEDVRTVILHGLDTGSYGLDIGSDFPELLEAILAVDADYEIYIRQFNPTWAVKYQERLLPLFSHPRVTSIQLPFQTTSARLLKLMRRPRQTREISNLLSQLHENNPNCILLTDMMVGFPTETWDELEDSVAFAQEMFDEIAVFAFEMKDGVALQHMNLEEHAPEEKQRRVGYAVEQLTGAGRIVHRGGQDIQTVAEIEAAKEALRQQRQSESRCSLN